MKSYYCWIVYKDKRTTLSSSNVVRVASRPLEYKTDMAYALKLFKENECARRGVCLDTLDRSIICGGVVQTTGDEPETMSL